MDYNMACMDFYTNGLLVWQDDVTTELFRQRKSDELSHCFDSTTPAHDSPFVNCIKHFFGTEQQHQPVKMQQRYSVPDESESDQLPLDLEQLVQIAFNILLLMAHDDFEIFGELLDAIVSAIWEGLRDESENDQPPPEQLVQIAVKIILLIKSGDFESLSELVGAIINVILKGLRDENESDEEEVVGAIIIGAVGESLRDESESDQVPVPE